MPLLAVYNIFNLGVKVKPDQALAILDGLVSRIQLTREQHIQAQTAVSTLAEAIKPKETPGDKPADQPS